MPATASPQGIRVASHVSGDPRYIVLEDGILSTYGTNLFTGTPVQLGTNGTIIDGSGAAAPIFGIFAGCEFTQTDGMRRVLPYWPAGQTYIAKSCIAKVVPINDPGVILIGQSAAAVAATARGESVGTAAVSGSTQTGLSSQALTAPAGVGPGSFTILDLVKQPDNDWGDPFVWLYLMIQTRQGPVA
jgi:hypothetical protein